MSSYRGNANVLEGVTRQRDENGAWTTTIYYKGIADVLRGMSVPLGAKMSIEEGEEGYARATVTIGNLNDGGQETVSERWEIDSEIVEKSILFHPLAQGMTPASKAAFVRWSQDPDRTAQVPASITADDTAAFFKLQEESLRGVESTSITTFILKRTRTMSANYAPVLRLKDVRDVYSSAKLKANEGIPNALYDTLPGVLAGNPLPAAPSSSAWSWLPRLQNRSYIGNGRVEEVSDWVFAAWSTNLYTYNA